MLNNHFPNRPRSLLRTIFLDRYSYFSMISAGHFSKTGKICAKPADTLQNSAAFNQRLIDGKHDRLSMKTLPVG